MTRKLKTAQLKVEQGLSKFENKLKKVLSLKQQSSAPEPDESCLQDVHPEIAAPQNSFADCTEQAPVQDESGISSNVGIEEIQSSTNISYAFPSTTPKPATSLQMEAQDSQQKALSYIGSTATSSPRQSIHSSTSGYSTPTPIGKLDTKKPRKPLTRSNSLPAAPSSPPTTPASSITFLNTPRHSLTSPFPTPIKPRQTPRNYKDPSKNHQNALTEYLQDEESQTQDTEWAALVQWITSAHRAEITKLTQKHVVELEQMCRDRDQLRGQLEMQSETSVEATTMESMEGVLLGCVYPKVVLALQRLAWFFRKPETFY